jgi:hypothetical protein
MDKKKSLEECLDKINIAAEETIIKAFRTAQYVARKNIPPFLY